MTNPPISMLCVASRYITRDPIVLAKRDTSHPSGNANESAFKWFDLGAHFWKPSTTAIDQHTKFIIFVKQVMYKGVLEYQLCWRKIIVW